MKLGPNIRLILLGMLFGYAGGLATLHALSQSKMPIKDDELRGLRLEPGIGIAGAARPPEGTWFQGHLEHHLQLRSRSYSLGISGDTPLKDMRWALRYANLGKFSTRAIANADADDNVAFRGMVNPDPRREQCSKEYAADCQYNYHGEGSAQTVLATVSAEPFKIGPVHVGIEAGAALTRATWRMRVRPIDCPANQCWEMQIDKRSGWQLGPEMGLTARIGYFVFAARRIGGPEKIVAGYAAPIRDFSIAASIPFSL